MPAPAPSLPGPCHASQPSALSLALPGPVSVKDTAGPSASAKQPPPTRAAPSDHQRPVTKAAAGGSKDYAQNTQQTHGTRRDKDDQSKVGTATSSYLRAAAWCVCVLRAPFSEALSCVCAHSTACLCLCGTCPCPLQAGPRSDSQRDMSGGPVRAVQEQGLGAQAWQKAGAEWARQAGGFPRDQQRPNVSRAHCQTRTGD